MKDFNESKSENPDLRGLCNPEYLEFERKFYEGLINDDRNINEFFQYSNLK